MPHDYVPLKDAGDGEGPSEEPIAGPSAADEPVLSVENSFVGGPRKPQDRKYGVLFVFYVVLTISLGGIFVNSANPDFFTLTHAEVLQNYDACHAPADGRGRALVEFPDITKQENTRVRTLAAISLGASAVGAAFLGLLFILLMQHNAPAMVRVTMFVQLFVPVVVGCGLLGSGAIGAGLFWLFIGALWAFVIHLWRPQLVLVGQLLGVAAHALNDNKHLITGTLAINSIMGLTTLPIAVFLGFAYADGDVQPSFLAERAAVDSQVCVGTDGAEAPCCVWMPHGGAIAYMAMAFLAMSWIVFFAFEVRLFTVAHVVGRWYYLPFGEKLRGWPVLAGVKTAVGPSFGTLALGSAVLTIADLMRQAAEAARNNNRGGGIMQLIGCLLSAIVSCIAEVITALTKFATVRAALTGEAFFAAARSATDLLARNFLDSYAVWRFPPMVLGLAAFVSSGLFGFVVFLGFSLAVGTPTSATATQLASQMSAGVGVGAGVLALVAMSFMSSVILNVVDVVYFCFALDKDRQMVTRQEVHDIFVLINAPQVPASGVPVEQQQPGAVAGYPAAGTVAPGQAVAPQYYSAV